MIIMKRIYAVQMDIECFEPEAYFNEEQAMQQHIFLGGNREFITMNKSLENDVRNALVDCNSDLDSIQNDDSISDEDRVFERLDTIKYYFDGQVGKSIILSIDDYNKLAQLSADFGNTYKYEEELDIICKALSILYKETFVFGLLRGSCQGDWIYYICPENIKNYVTTQVESIFFGTGTEFKVAILDTDKIDTTDIDNIINEVNEADFWCEYTYLYKEEDIKEYLAKNASYGDNHFTKDDVELILIDERYNIVKYTYKIS